jgi:hypothetical protein
MRKNEWSGAALRSSGAATLALLLMSGCAATTVVGSDAGCAAYSEARLLMPRAEPLPTSKWGDWIVDTDDRMTGTCR